MTDTSKRSETMEFPCPSFYLATFLVLMMWRQDDIQSVTRCWVRVAMGLNTDLAGAEAVGGARLQAGVG